MSNDMFSPWYKPSKRKNKDKEYEKYDELGGESITSDGMTQTRWNRLHPKHKIESKQKWNRLHNY